MNKMEKFYIVTKESSLHKNYLEYKENRKQIREISKEFMSKHDIESNTFCPYTEAFYIEPTEKDKEKFASILCKPVDKNLCAFKKNSVVTKDWIKTLKDKNIRVLSRPFLGFYFPVYGEHKTRLFDIDGIIYCSISANHDFTNPNGFTEMKASEFYKIIEDYEAKEV